MRRLLSGFVGLISFSLMASVPSDGDVRAQGLGASQASRRIASVGAAPSKAPKNPCDTSHQGVFYQNNFSYLNDPAYDVACLGDAFKLLPAGPDGRFGKVDLGGQLRLRSHDEHGMGQSRGLGRFENTDTTFFLTRLRLYTNWQVNENLRFFAEGLFADATDDEGDYLPRNIDRNYGDFLNLFADLKLLDGATVRVGRQELLYGSERLISSLDWANIRRTFEGAKLMTQWDDWKLDGFYTHVVPVVPNTLDEADYNQAVYGAYATYAGFERFTVDSYYIGYDSETPGSITSDFSLHTFGMRINGSIDDWLFELEGGPQIGRQSGLGLDHEAGFCTCGLGRNLGSVLPWSPTLWAYYDYASGNNVGGDFNQFNQLFPLVHKYFGFIDAVQRSNIESPNVLLTMQPTKKINLLFWYWHFMANQDTDIVPALGGTPAQSTASKDLGDELDIIARYKIGPRSNVLTGYSHFWRGNKILAPRDADFVYGQWELNF